MHVVRRNSVAGVARALDRAIGAEPTWHSELSIPAPPGFYADDVHRALGFGAEVFTRAADVMMTWGVQRGAGLTVLATTERAVAGATFVTGLPFGPSRILAPCRVVAATATARRSSLRFVTVAGHPEIGIEEFSVEHSDDDSVAFVIRAVSRPASALARLGRPVAREIQQRTTHRYLAAITA
jgi:uncharacterized protein (UPF0548 family)